MQEGDGEVAVGVVGGGLVGDEEAGGGDVEVWVAHGWGGKCRYRFGASWFLAMMGCVEMKCLSRKWDRS